MFWKYPERTGLSPSRSEALLVLSPSTASRRIDVDATTPRRRGRETRKETAMRDSIRHGGRPFARIGASLMAFALAGLTVTAIPTRADTAPPEIAQREFTVMTYNLYLGANLQPLFGKSGQPLIDEAQKVLAHVAQTDFSARAEAIADQIVEQQPVVVGLQEVALWQTAPIGAPGQRQTAFDFLAILLDALQERGMPYRAASVNVDFSAALPISFTTLGVFTDRNVIIVRDDLPSAELKVSDPTDHLFRAVLPVPIGDGTINVTRGWATVDVKFRGKPYLVANTHLEAFNGFIRTLQAQELAASLDASALPVVLLGDLNSEPGNLADSYGVMLRAGFVDGWIEAMDGTPGFTAGQTDDLNNVPSLIDHTVDYVMHNEDGFVDAVAGSGDIVGEELDDRTPSGLWPSDHAGIALTMHIADP
jgi:endonuclease/exonuclease/phosphatase family metal-dependent hydrolase